MTGLAAEIRRVVFAHPLLRGIDARGQDEIAAVARVRHLQAGDVVFRRGEDGDMVFVVVSGQVELSAVRRGDERASVVRVAGPSDTFGEDALLAVGAPRRISATAAAAAVVAQLPVSLLWRGAGRAGAAALAQREMRLWRRRATADLLATMAATRDLPEAERELLLDAVVHVTRDRGETIYAAGDAPDGLYLVVDGLVQLQEAGDEAVGVRAYLLPGDGFGDEDALAGQPRMLSAVAMGKSRLLLLPTEPLRTAVDRNPRVLQRLRRIETDRAGQQAAIMAEADARSTQHVFHDLYRMQIARSLLVIDQQSCVRCGHCAWACADVHDGVARLVRRGDKVLTTVGGVEQSLLVVNSCQHCKNPSCMIDCPTGAIGRDPGGEVFIRDDLCTGCGNCAKACPWENIRMAPRAKPGTGPSATATSLATKCDLCRDYTGPACVQACPTSAITRLDPNRDVAEIAALGGVRARPGRGGLPWGSALVAGAGVAAAGATVYAWRLQSAGQLRPGTGDGWWAGVIAAIAIGWLLSYAIPKRVIRLWLRRRPKGRRRQQVADTPPPRSKVRPWYLLHLCVGLVAIVGVVAHAGARMPADPSGSLHAAFWLVTGLGLLSALSYRVVPRTLARLERVGALPEDLPAQRDELVDALYRRASGQDARTKQVVAQVLVPYTRSLLGPLALLVSGRSLAQERRRLATRIGGDAALPPALHDMVRTVVQLRAWPLRVGLSALLRVFTPLHVLSTGLLVALLAVHIAVMGGGP